MTGLHRLAAIALRPAFTPPGGGAVTDAVSVAHDPVAPGELWGSWQPDPLVVAGLALAAVLYHHGAARLRAGDRARRRPPGHDRRHDRGGNQGNGRGRDRAEPRGEGRKAPPGTHREGQGRRRAGAARFSPPGRRQVAAFDAGLMALVVALASPLDAAAASLFSAHMAQHLVLLVVAPPLLAAGRAGPVLVMALPTRLRRPLRAAVARRPAAPGVQVAASWALATVVLWAWHLPSLYEAALRQDAVHAVEHATLLATATWLWAAVLGRCRRAVPVPARVLLVFLTSLQGAALGAVLALAREPLYAVHEPVAPRWGLSPLEDQQLAGGLMWVLPGLVHLATMATLLARWLAALDEGEGPHDARPPGPGSGATPDSGGASGVPGRLDVLEGRPA